MNSSKSCASTAIYSAWTVSDFNDSSRFLLCFGLVTLIRRRNYTHSMNEELNSNSPLDGFELFDNSNMSRVVNKITITKSNQFNFPAAFYQMNRIEGKKGAMLYFNKQAQKVAVTFTDEAQPQGFRLALSNEGKYGAYISARSFLTLNGISDTKYAKRYDYDKQTLADGQTLYIIDLTKGEDGDET